MWLAHREVVLRRLPVILPDLPRDPLPYFSRDLVKRAGRRTDHLGWACWSSDAYWTAYTRWSDGDETNFFPRDHPPVVPSYITGGDVSTLRVQEVYNSVLDFWETATSDVETFFRSAIVDLRVSPRVMNHLGR